MGRNNDYTTGNLLDYEYFSKHYKLVAIDLSKQNELENSYLRQQWLSWKVRRNNFWIYPKAATVVWFCLSVKMETQKIVNLLGDADNECSKFATTKYYVINDQKNQTKK